MTEETFKGEMVAYKTDFAGYKTCVFKDLEDPRYIMCKEFPNWDFNINVGDSGIVKVKHVTNGNDKWFDGRKFIPYKKTDIHLLEFVPLKKEEEIKIKL